MLQGPSKHGCDRATAAVWMNFRGFHAGGEMNDGEFVIKAGIALNRGSWLDVHLCPAPPNWDPPSRRPLPLQGTRQPSVLQNA